MIRVLTLRLHALSTSIRHLIRLLCWLADRERQTEEHVQTARGSNPPNYTLVLSRKASLTQRPFYISHRYSYVSSEFMIVHLPKISFYMICEMLLSYLQQKQNTNVTSNYKARLDSLRCNV